MTILEQRDSDRFCLRQKFDLVWYLIGVPILLIGGGLGVLPLVMNLGLLLLGKISGWLFMECVLGMLIGMLIGLPMVCGGWLLLFWNHRFEIDMVRKTIVESKDALVWSRETTLDFAELKSVKVRRIEKRDRKQGWRVDVTLVTEQGDFQFANESDRHEEPLRQLANETAKLLNLPVISETKPLDDDE